MLSWLGVKCARVEIGYFHIGNLHRDYVAYRITWVGHIVSHEWAILTIRSLL